MEDYVTKKLKQNLTLGEKSYKEELKCFLIFCLVLSPFAHFYVKFAHFSHVTKIMDLIVCVYFFISVL